MRSRFRRGRRSRRFGRRRHSFKRRRTGRRRRSTVSKRGDFYQMKHMVQYSDITAAANSTSVGFVGFNASEIPNWADFSAIWEQYRITGIKVRFIPRTTVSALSYDGTTAETERVTEICSVLDFTEDFLPTATPPTYAQQINYGNVKITHGNREHHRFLKPSVLVPSYITATTTANCPRRKVWIDTEEDTVPHLGMAYGINSTSGFSTTLGVYVTYWVQFKGRRL